MSTARFAASLEALLFARGNPVSLKELTELLHADAGRIEEGLDCLRKKYEAEDSGILLHQTGGGWCLSTKREYGDWISGLMGKSAPLSPAAMETLAVIACKEPVIRAEIEKIRGVSADRVLSSLLEKGLIEERGRLDVPGRPILYGTTELFLKCTGLSDVEELRSRWDTERKEEGRLF